MNMKTKISIAKTKLNVKVDVPENTQGTLQWFKDLLIRSELVIMDTPNDCHAIYLKTVDKDNIIRHYKMLCKPIEYGDEYSYQSFCGKYSYILPVKKENKIGLFDFPLTPKCEREVRKLIRKAVFVFSDWWVLH